MYSIGYVIWGLPLTEAASKKMEELEDEEIFIKDYFDTVYDGSLPYEPGWCGVCTKKFNAILPIQIKDFPVLESPEQVSEAANKLKKLKTDLPEIYELCGGESAVGEWIIFGTS